MQRGNCYATSEAAYHILGGKAAGWKPMVMRVRGGTHWFLKHEDGRILDLSVRQFKKPPNYSRARGTGFLTREPSKAARRMIDLLTFKESR